MSARGAALPNGTVVDGFSVLSVLGIGRFGITYEARDESLGRTVALKEYYPNYIARRDEDQSTLSPADAAFSQDYHHGFVRFLDEARVLAKFKSPISFESGASWRRTEPLTWSCNTSKAHL